MIIAYSRSGKPHRIKVEYDRHLLSYVVKIDDKLYSRADSRAEADEDAGDVIRCRGWVLDKPAQRREA